MTRHPWQPRDSEAVPGTVYLVGAGPGDPGLLTLRAAALLGSADLVLHDQLVTSEILALARPGAEVVGVGRRCGNVVVGHGDVVDRMVAAARDGRRVVRLKGGDPVVFGRGGEEAAECATAGVPVVFVPGISSAIAAPEAAGIPLTLRDVARGFLVVTARTREADGGVDWSTIAGFDGTIVVLMGRRRWSHVADGLIAGGRADDEPAAGVAWATTPGQRVVTAPLRRIARAAEDVDLPTPAVLVVGEVVAARVAAATPRSVQTPAS